MLREWIKKAAPVWGLIILLGLGGIQAEEAYGRSITLTYARRLTIEKVAAGHLVTIRPAWIKGDNSYRYLLVPKDQKVVYQHPAAQVIKVPVERLVSLSTTHLAYLDAAGKSRNLVGIGSFKHVNTASVRRLINGGKLKEVGNFNNLKIETLMELAPDLILTHASGSIYDAHPKLKEAGLPALLVVDDGEAHPLGRAEWCKLFGLLLGTADHAEELFGRIEARYLKLAKKTQNVSLRPAVITGAPFQGQWWVARGDSFVARFLKDAGGNYLWSDVPGVSSLPMDIEAVYQKALLADVWLNTGSWLSLKQAYGSDPRFAALPALQKGRLYNNNKRLNQWGGNDYWESGMLNPDVVLADLIAVLHPELLPEHKLFYYRKLTEKQE